MINEDNKNKINYGMDFNLKASGENPH